MPSVYATLYSISQFGRIFGLVAFAPKIDGYVPSKLSAIWCFLYFSLVTLFSLGLLFWLPVTSLYEDETKADGEDQHIIVMIADTIEAYVSTFTMCACHLYAFLRRNKIMGIVNSLGSFDKMLSNIDIDVSRISKYSPHKIAIGLVLIVIYFFTYFSLELLFLKCNSIAHVFMYSMPIGVTSFVVLQFAATMSMLRKRLQILNGYFDDCLRKIGASTLDDNMADFTCSLFSDSTTNENNKIDYSLENFAETISYLHCKLHQIGDEITEAFSTQILFIIVQSLVTLIATAFYLVSILLSESDAGSWMYVYTIYVCIFCLTQIVTVVVLSIAINLESKQTGKILFKTKEYINRKQFQQKLYFSFQLIHNSVDFEACRGFPVDGKLLLTILGSMTTYLLIVIQFQMNMIQSKSTIMGSSEDTLSNRIINP